MSLKKGKQILIFIFKNLNLVLISSNSFFSLLAEQSLPLLKPPFLKYFATCCALMFGLFSIASGIAMFMPDILNRLLLANDKYETSMKICEIYKVALKDDDEDVS
jgi:hypothetical protein